MKFQFWSIGKGNEKYVVEGVNTFTKRISHYYPVEWKFIPPVKNAATMPIPEVKKKEAEVVLAHLSAQDYLVLLDENGKILNSEQVAGFIQERANAAEKNIIFLIGGAFGSGEKLLARANFKWSLSKLVFPHQLVRLILSEQVYRACTILKNEKYHHS